MKRAFLMIAVLIILLILGCTFTGTVEETPEQKLRMATTTSTYDSGLLDILNSAFQQKCKCVVEVIPRGTGAAIQTAKDGDADLIFVHARSMEDDFVNDGYGINRKDVMYNDFVILGPESDPAGIKDITNAAEAFSKIAVAGNAGNAVFFSRGDNSGTHTKEKVIWGAANIKPAGTWYNSVGKGMGDTITIANEKLGYTIADRGTYVKWKDKQGFELKVLVEGPVKGGDPILMNPYGIIAVNPKRYPEVNYNLAMEYIDFVTSEEGQNLIEGYEVNGEQLFYPNAK